MHGGESESTVMMWRDKGGIEGFFSSSATTFLLGHIQVSVPILAWSNCWFRVRSDTSFVLTCNTDSAAARRKCAGGEAH